MRIGWVCLVLVALAADARANGRDPYTSTITFKHGSDQDIIAGMTFGLLVSHDGGATWRWMCERAVGYGGMYDPDYAYSSSDAVFATTFDGLKVMRDRCSFTATPPGMTFVSRVEIGPDNAVYYTAADPMDAKVYKSTNDGTSFSISASPGQAGDWWQSLAVAPSDANRVYVTGYRLVAGNPKVFLLFKSIDGGVSYSPMVMTGITPTSASSNIEVVGISATNASEVYIKVTFENGTNGDSIYKSTDAGGSWTKILTKTSTYGLAFLKRNDGTCIAGTRELGAWQSTGCDATWTALGTAPHIGCLAQDSTGLVYACTQNYASLQAGLTSDGYGIMKSTDLATWTGVVRYQDIAEPVVCDPSTIQTSQCVEPFNGQSSIWCCLVAQLFITTTAINCTGSHACAGIVVDGVPDASVAVVDSAPDAPGAGPAKPGCGCGSQDPAGLLTLLVTGGLLLRRKRPSAGAI